MMGTKRDYYDILGVSKGASSDDIKKAYRKLVMQYHPDRVSQEHKKEAEEKFKEISEAYAVLNDPKKRSLYDQYGHAGIDSRFSTEDIFRSANFSDIFGSGGFGSSIFDDILSGFGFDIFGSSRRGSSGRARGDDIHYEFSISLEDAAVGGSKSISFPRFEMCPECKGSGAQPGSTKKTCPTCRGRGQVTSGMGFISIAQTCPTCRGEGVVISAKCSKCRGQGVVRVNKTVTVNIPGGVDTGSVLRLRNEGNFGTGGYGDFYLHLNVKRHHVFERRGSDLKCKVKISMIKAVLGGEIEVPTLLSKAKMKIPAGTQPNTIFRLRGKGLSDLKTKRLGDELVEVEVEIPRKLSVREKNLLLELGKLRREL